MLHSKRIDGARWIARTTERAWRHNELYSYFLKWFYEHSNRENYPGSESAVRSGRGISATVDIAVYGE